MNTKPLVRIDRDGFFIFSDPMHPNFEYDFLVRDKEDAMRWYVHVIEKSWVTKEHMMEFSYLLLDKFGINR